MDLSAVSSLVPSPTSTLFVLVTLLFLLTHLARQKHHPSEPSIVPPQIPLPYIGHLISMALQGSHYLKHLGRSHPTLPIMTLAVPFSRIYLVTDPSLAAAVQRRPARQLSFNALLPDVVRRVMGLDAKTRAIVARGLDPERGEVKGFLAELHDMLVSFLGPGSGRGELEELTVRAVRELGAELDRYADGIIASRSGGEDTVHVEGEVVELLPWVRHLVAQATSRLLYGPRNPFALRRGPARRELEDAFWDFDRGLGRLLMGVFPSVTARRAFRGREKLVAAFRAYVEAEHYEPTTSTTTSTTTGLEAGAEGKEGGEDEGASQIVLNRIRIARSHGFSADGIARSEVSFLFAGIVNTATTTFWAVLRIFADRRGLLATVREELAAATSAHTTTDTGRVRTTLGISALPRTCPTLHAVYREVLRLGSNHLSTRLVRENVALTAAGGAQGRSFYLRKGGVVQIAGGAMHADARIWGRDAGAFNPGRFLNGGMGAKGTEYDPSGGPAAGEEEGRQGRGNRGGVEDGPAPVHPAAFRSFGGGKTVCPGRHFATGEILGLVASIVLRFEIEGADGGGGIEVPACDEYVLPVHILEPVGGKPVRVRVRVREGEGDESVGRVEVVP